MHPFDSATWFAFRKQLDRLRLPGDFKLDSSKFNENPSNHLPALIDDALLFVFA